MKFSLHTIAAAFLALAAHSSAAFTGTPATTHKNAASAMHMSTSSSSPVTLVGAVDEEALLAASAFPIAADDLIARAKEVLNPAVKLGQADGGACLADDFEFVAAVVGPIGKDEYLNALGSFKLEDSFEIQPNFFGFSVDPLQTNRVWFFTRQEGTHVAEFMGAKATGNTLVLPPQAHHIDFDKDGKIKEFGFYTCDRRQGNTGGLGGAFGYFYGVGKPLPIPECQPYKKSFRFRLLGFVGSLARKLKRD